MKFFLAQVMASFLGRKEFETPFIFNWADIYSNLLFCLHTHYVYVLYSTIIA